jgi:two-component sensor histidine kinase
MGRDIPTLLRQQAALAAFGSFAFQENDLNKILTEAARICAESLAVKFCKICRYREAENDLRVEAGYGWEDHVVGHVISKADESSPQGRAFITGKPVIILNLQEANDYNPPPFYEQHRIISTVDVIIKARSGAPFGILEIDSAEKHAYDKHDIDFLTGFANILAEAVATADRNGQMFEMMGKMKRLIEEKDILLAEKHTLSQELQHRVRNNLQLVNGMLGDQLKLTHDEDGKRGMRGIIRRVMSLAQVYDQLFGVGLSDRLDFGAYLTVLCADLPELQPKPLFPIQLLCQVEELVLDLASVTALGLVAAELVSNSYEHAFPDKGGTVRVTVATDGSPDRGIMVVQDDGVGYTAAPETKRRGVGLARRLMQQVNGTLDVISVGGTTWSLRFPISIVSGSSLVTGIPAGPPAGVAA